MQKKKQIAVLGYGVVGSGVVELFYQNQEKIEKNTGYPMDIKYILDLRTFEGDPYADKVVHDINVILQDPEVGYVAECMGGVNPAFEFVSSCLKAGKSVSTSNKQLGLRYDVKEAEASLGFFRHVKGLPEDAKEVL